MTANQKKLITRWAKEVTWIPIFCWTLIPLFMATIAYSNDNWTRLKPPAKPSPRFESAIASHNNQVFLFGGSISNQIYNDTWSWNKLTNNWTLMNNGTIDSPSHRGGGSMAWDGTRFILFGGGDSTEYFNETWAWDGKRWSELDPANKPTKREHACMVYNGNKVILFGGNNEQGLLNDTWEWDGSDWTQSSPNDSPPGRTNGAAAYDGTQIVMFGGLGEDGFLNDTWTWNGTNWTEENPGSSPSARSLASIAAAPNNTILLYGGYTQTGALDDTWEWNSSEKTWEQINPDTIVPDRCLAPMAWDGEKFVLFGGQLEDGASNATWAYADLVYPCASATGKIVKKNYKYQYKLNWQASPTTNVAKYQITLGDKVIGKTKNLKYTAGPYKKRKKRTYGITTINTASKKSAPFKVVLPKQTSN